MRMIDTLTRARLEREATRDDGAFCCADRIEDGLGKLSGQM